MKERCDRDLSTRHIVIGVKNIIYENNNERLVININNESKIQYKDIF